jgi:hypothetical protein
MSSLDALTDQEFEIWLLAQTTDSESQKQSMNDKKKETILIPKETECFKEEDIKDMETIARVKKPKKVVLKEKKEIHLLPNQEEHVKNLTKILDKLPFALDFSMLGAGKTYTSSFIALQRKYKHIIVVCPVSVLSKWKHMEETYHLPIRATMGYQSLRSVSYRQPSHGLLYRRDYKDTMQIPHPYRINETIETTVDKTEFTVTKEFKTMVEEGLLLIFDEIQNVKNISSQFLAAQALIKEITLTKGDLIEACERKEVYTSQVLLLSGSPIDKVEQAVHIFRLLGIMNENRISQYNIQTGVSDWKGMNEIHNFCRYMNPKLLEALPAKRYWETLNEYSYRMFQHVFKHECSSSMIAPKSEIKLVKRNAYYNIDKEGEEIIQRGLGQLRTAAQWDGSTVHFVGATTEAFASVTRSLQIIETGKIQLFARLAKQSLQANPKAKVVIAVNYSETVKDLLTELKEYTPLVLTGSTSSNQRGTILEAFQNNESKYRLLICNQGVASTGIDLDDKEGSYPRVAFVSPNYSTITSYQLGHRFQRMDSKSDAYVNFVFAKREGKTREQCQDIIELRVLDALSRKSQVMKETTTQQVKAGIVFPGDHEEWFE